jgi:hypothetical protein
MVFFVSNVGKYILVSPGLHKRLFQVTALNPLLLHTEDVLFSWRIWIHILNMDPDPVGKMSVDPDLKHYYSEQIMHVSATLSQKKRIFPRNALECIWEQVLWPVNFRRGFNPPPFGNFQMHLTLSP